MFSCQVSKFKKLKLNKDEKGNLVKQFLFKFNHTEIPPRKILLDSV